jgi:serine/threonine protein kinase
MLGHLLTGRYLILQKLGTGGFSETYLARDKYLPLHPLCVVKRLKLSPRNPLPPAIARQMFATEIQVLSHLKLHPHTPMLLASCQGQSEAFLVQEYIEGEDLAEWLAQGNRLNAEQAIALLQEMLGVLSQLHAQGIVHRDIKPGHLIHSQKDGRMIVIDFGAACLMSEGCVLSRAEMAIGTPGYMPPEQQHCAACFSSDLYALGISVIQLLTGMKPQQFQVDPISGELDWKSYLTNAPDVLANQNLIDTLERMVRQRAIDRFPQATDAMESLDPQLKPPAFQWMQTLRNVRASASLRYLLKPAAALLLLGLAGGKLIQAQSHQTAALKGHLEQLLPQPQVQLTLVQQRQFPVAVEQMWMIAGDRLVTTDPSGVLRLWSLPDGKLLHTLTGHPDGITALGSSRDGSVLVTGGRDHNVRLWDTASGQLLRTLEGAQVEMTAIALSPDSSTAVVGGADGSLSWWNLQTGEHLQTLALPAGRVSALVYTAVDQVISASNDRSTQAYQIQVWDLNRGEIHRTFTGHTDAITALKIVGDHTLLSCGKDRTLLWDLSREELVQAFPKTVASIAATAVNSPMLIMAYQDGSVQHWIERSGQFSEQGKTQVSQKVGTMFDINQHYVVDVSADRQLTIWRIEAASIP